MDNHYQFQTWAIVGIYAILLLLVVLTGVCSGLALRIWRRVAATEATKERAVAKLVEDVRERDAGHDSEAAAVLAALEVIGRSVENMRGQNSAEHGSMSASGGDTNAMVRRILSRLGFLVAADGGLDKAMGVAPLKPSDAVP